MMNELKRGGAAASLRRIVQYRNLEYFLFIAIIIWKLGYMHSHLHANNIDMSKLDYVIAIGSVMVASFWTLWLPRRGRGIALSILNLLITALIFSDLVYYRYFQDFITIPVLLQAGQVGELGGSIRELIHWTDIWFFVDWLLYIPMIFTLARKRRNTTYIQQSDHPVSRWKRITGRFVTGVVTFSLGLALTLGPINHYTSTWAVGLFVGNWWNLALYNVTGLLGFHYYDAYKYALEHWGPKKQLSEQELTDIKQWYEQARADRPVKNETFGAYKGSNVLVVQAEAFMNFMIGKQVNGQEITPNFNKLMKESLYYSNYYHQTGQGRTSDADFSSHSSLHPLPTGSVFTRYPDHKYDVLPQILKSDGYFTAAFHAYDSSFWNRYTMYKNMGYDKFYSKKDYNIDDEPLGWSLGDKSFFKQSLDFMDKEKQPFYSYMITLSSHHPYSLPEPVQQLDVGEFNGTIFGDYLEAVHYTDAALGQLVEQMKAEGLWDKSILYFYGDHDNSIKDKSYYEKFLGRSLNDLDMEQIMNQVPLLVHLPDSKHAGVYEQPSGQLDMTPSLMHLLGISSKPYYMMGNDIFDERDKMVVLRTGAFTDGSIYYIPSADGVFENGTCYDLSTRQKTDIERARPGYEEAKKRLDYSDKTILYDLINKFEEASPKGS